MLFDLIKNRAHAYLAKNLYFEFQGHQIFIKRGAMVLKIYKKSTPKLDHWLTRYLMAICGQMWPIRYLSLT